MWQTLKRIIWALRLLQKHDAAYVVLKKERPGRVTICEQATLSIDRKLS